ncbi:MAG: type II toxin-antitoxin system Phd/YefM family antitoxin [Planctomycetaceae bacterium]|nr:type II toxin-antitoxin system Phd/YefM family antitoxin [Planctomycetaceae bacterium]
MTLIPAGDVKTITELACQAEQIVRQVSQTGRPVTVTSGGGGDVVIVDAEQYNRWLKTINLAALLAEGESDVRTGRVRPLDDFLRELASDQDIPG